MDGEKVNFDSIRNMLRSKSTAWPNAKHEPDQIKEVHYRNMESKRRGSTPSDNVLAKCHFHNAKSFLLRNPNLRKKKMDETGIGRITNSHSVCVFPSIIQDLLSNFTNYNCRSFVVSVFGTVPTSNEVEYAVAALHSFMQKVPNSELSWNDQRIMHSSLLRKADDAFHLLQTVPSVQMMVISVASDKAVIKNNKIQEFQRSLKQGELEQSTSSDFSIFRFDGGGEEKQNLVSVILWWMLNNMKLTLMGLNENLKSLVIRSFDPSEEENRSKYQLQDLFSSTVLLSILTLMIVMAMMIYKSMIIVFSSLKSADS